MIDWQKVFLSPKDMCFGCGIKNPIGLKLDFKYDGEKAIGEFLPNENFQGWPGIVHGGIIANIMDECAASLVAHNNLLGVTAKLEVLYHHPTKIGIPLIITGSKVKNNGKRFVVRSQINTMDGTLIAEAKTLLIVMDNHFNNTPVKPTFFAIWDMDGVIVDTASCHFESWHHVFEKQDINFTKVDFEKKFGQRNDAIISSTLNRKVTLKEIDNIASDKEKYFRNCIKDRVKPFPGAVELLKLLKKRNIKMAIASSAPMENIELLINSLGIKDCFHILVSGKDVTESKPSPQIFLLAAHRLGANPKQCIVFEDAIAGVSAAKKAGMYCIAVTATNPRNKLLDADLIVDTLEDVNINTLKEAIAKR